MNDGNGLSASGLERQQSGANRRDARTWWSRVFPWRWWWNTTLLLIVMICVSQYWAEKNWEMLRGRMNVVVGSVMLALWLSMAAWLFVIVPWLCARERAPRFRAAPLSYFAALRLLVWVPALLMAGQMFFETVYLNAVHYFQTEQFRLRLPWWYVLPALLILGSAVWYGRWMTRRLEARIREQAALSRYCYECGYPLHSLAGARCPECGEAIPILVEASGFAGVT